MVMASEVVDLLAEHTGVPRDEVKPSSRLLHDLGMDGDDAVEFFAALQRRFGTDLASLYEHWAEHFGPEGISSQDLLLLVPIGLAVAAPILLFDLPVWAALALALPLGGLSVWLCSKLPIGPRMRPITVANVIAAVERGRWPKKPA